MLGFASFQQFTIAVSSDATPATCCDVHPSKMLAISGCHDGRIITWVLIPQLESRGYKLAVISKFSIHDREITDIRFHPDGERVISASLDGTIKLCSFQDRGKGLKVRHTFRCNSPVFSCSFSKDSMFAVASSFRYVSVFDIQAGLLYKEFTAHELNVHQASWHPNDSKSLVTCGDDKTIKVWDLATKTHTSEYHLESWVWTARFLNRVPPRFIVGGTQHGFVKIFDERVGSNTDPYHVLQHRGPVRHVEIGMNSFYTCGASACIKKHTISTLETECIMRGHLGSISQFRIDPFTETAEETIGISAASDSTVKLWNLRSTPPAIALGT